MVDQDTLQSVLFNLNLLVEKVINLEYKFDVLNKQLKSKQSRRRSSAETERNNAVIPIPDTQPENTDIRNCLEININPVPPIQQNDELVSQLEEAKANLEGIVDERDFYFGKLRDIEIFCQIQESNPTILKILDLLYATESKSLKPSLAPRRFPYSPPPEDANIQLSSNGERGSLEMEDILLPRETREPENLIERPPPPDLDEEDVQPNPIDDENDTDYND